MSHRFVPQATAFGLAALVTVATLGGLSALANDQYSEASIELAEANPPLVQRVEIIGNAVQQVVITGRKRS